MRKTAVLANSGNKSFSAGSRHVLVISCMAAALSWVPVTYAAVEKEVSSRNGNEIWISVARQEGETDGTKARPFDGSTEKKLEAILAATAANTIIHFGRGTFLKKGIVNGGASVKAGQHWIGAGAEATTIKLNSMSRQASACIDYALGNASDQDAAGAVIENMTIDCNAGAFLAKLGTNAVKADAIQLHGASNMAVRRVRIIHNHGDIESGIESFPLTAGGFTVSGRDTWCKNVLFDHVTIEKYAPNHTYGGAISLYLVDGGVIQDCIVRENKNGTSAYGFAGANCSLLKCQAIDCGAFFYAELNNGDPVEIAAHGGWRNFTIKNCKAWIGSGFRDNNRGKFGGWFCLIANGKVNDTRGLDGLEVEDNEIFINRGATNIENGPLVHVYRAADVPMKNFVIKKNAVRQDRRSARTPGGPYYRYNVDADNVTYGKNVFADGWPAE